MDTAEAITKLNKIWEYSLKNEEDWLIPTKSGKGDCEDYVNGVAWYVGGESRFGMIKVIFSKRITWHHASIAGDERLDHMMGRCSKTNKWFDNNWLSLVTWDQINQAWGMDRKENIWIDKKPLGRFYVFRKLLWPLIFGPS